MKARNLFSLIIISLTTLVSFGQTYTFTNCGATGRFGPTQVQCDATYGAGVVTINTQGIQEWTVPATTSYLIEVYGAQGAHEGGLGAYMSGEFLLNAGDVLQIAIGQQGIIGESSTEYGGQYRSGGGGGGSFVVDQLNNPLIIAGGGGGGGNNGGNGSYGNIGQGGDGQITDVAGNNHFDVGGGTGGQGGDDGNADGPASGGGGFFTNGMNGNGGTGGQSWFNGLVGGVGGNSNAYIAGDGGFGGGGGSWHNSLERAGGGGGYSGGQGGSWLDYSTYPFVGFAGGGGSFNSGSNQNNIPGVRTGHGLIVITVLCTGVSNLTCPSNITVNAVLGNCSQVVAYTTPTYDAGNCLGASILAQTDGSGLTAGDLFPVGTTTQEYTVTDGGGNWDVCSFTVTVVDNQNPIITGCPSNQTSNTIVGQCSAVVSWAEPTASDNCTGVTMAPVPQGPGSTFPVGTTPVVYAATDASGNSVTCAFDVIVTDNEAPVVDYCPNDTTVTADPGLCSAVVTLEIPMTSDNCGIASVTSVPASDSDFPVGTTTVAWTVTDVNVNSTTTCLVEITVTDDEVPTALCVPFTVQLDASGNGSFTPANIDGGSTDACGIATLSASPNVFTCADLGVNLVTLTVTDNNGNTSTCGANVTVEDNESPTISVSLDGATLTCDNTADTYQWIDCDNGNAPVVGATEQSFTPSANGNYAVITDIDSCADTSACANIAVVGLEDNMVIEDMIIYPNPSMDGVFEIKYNGQIAQVDVIDMLGRIISLPVNLTDQVIDGSELTSGKYMVRVYTDFGIIVNKEVVIVK